MIHFAQQIYQRDVVSSWIEQHKQNNSIVYDSFYTTETKILLFEILMRQQKYKTTIVCDIYMTTDNINSLVGVLFRRHIFIYKLLFMNLRRH